MDWHQFEEHCFQITIQSIKTILSENPDEDFYSFALYTDSSVMSVSLAANSKQKLNAILDADSDKSEENKRYYRWTTSEWAYESDKAALFNGINKILRSSSDRERFSGFKNSLINTLIKVLKRANDTLCHHKYILFVSITDDDNAEYIENMSSEMINSHASHDLFSKRYRDKLSEKDK